MLKGLPLRGLTAGEKPIRKRSNTSSPSTTSTLSGRCRNLCRPATAHPVGEARNIQLPQPFYCVKAIHIWFVKLWRLVLPAQDSLVYATLIFLRCWTWTFLAWLRKCHSDPRLMTAYSDKYRRNVTGGLRGYC
ncbi:hypothetical protein E2C01_039695 [Portunus trituberculatus]|uniref:Uncharacterized protein n=1 Tax=Portunus trituberculatus TaxID=210409 RepID=A0A5B7FEG8_PORTR|nr:hypothetical protein [Portunus trituberculatus]